MSWPVVAPDGTHHLVDGTPAYGERFDAVLKFHAPGFAPVERGGRAWHIRPDGTPAYAARFVRTFGFYEGRAAVVAEDGWHHVGVDGRAISRTRAAWCGNFQEGRCPVRDGDGTYHHITLTGEPAYDMRWRYAGDFRDGIAVVQRDDGLSTHIDRQGGLIHGRWFEDLDVYHKGLARARDARGWTHVDLDGRPCSPRRFAAVEPFYNGQARVECHDGLREIVDEVGRTRLVLRPPRTSIIEGDHGERAHELGRHGFTHVPGVLAPAVVAALRAAIAEVIAAPGIAGDDLLRAADGHARKLTYPLDKHPAFLQALAEPALLDLALGLAPDPEDIVLTWEDILLKPPAVGLAVPPHQDIALQSVGGGVFSLGVHLDDADLNPVWFLPGSHVHGPLTRDEVAERARSGRWTPVVARAGDVIAHDVLVVHRSEANTGARARTTWYLEFRTRARLRRDGPWPERWIADRRALLFHAAAAREAAGLPVLWPPCKPGERREDWLARPRNLRVPHTAFGVEYDLQSPYHHFA